jgi:hypothetical protein
LRSPVEPEERENMDMEAVAHGLVLLVVYLQEQHIWVLFRELANLHREIKFRNRAKAELKYFRNYTFSYNFLPWGEGHGNRRSQGRRSQR